MDLSKRSKGICIIEVRLKPGAFINELPPAFSKGVLQR